jgi:putative flippase GtrA
LTIVRFAIVGVSNTLVTLASYAVLAHVGIAPPVAAAAAWALGAANGYRLNRSWTFRSKRRGPRTAARYVVVQGLGALLSALAVAAVPMPKLGAEALVLPIVTLVTYTLSRRLVFGGPRPA